MIVSSPALTLKHTKHIYANFSLEFEITISSSILINVSLGFRRSIFWDINNITEYGITPLPDKFEATMD